MVVGEISVIPVADVDMRPCIDAAVEAIRGCGLEYEVGALGTTVEGSLEQVLAAVQAAHRAAMDRGAGRCVTEVRIDERRGVDLSIDREVRGYRVMFAPQAGPVPATVAVTS